MPAPAPARIERSVALPIAAAFFAHRQRRRRALASVLAPEDGAAWPA